MGGFVEANSVDEVQAVPVLASPVLLIDLWTGIRIFLPSQLLLFLLRGRGRRLLVEDLLLVLIYLHAAHLGKDILRFDILQSLG